MGGGIDCDVEVSIGEEEDFRVKSEGVDFFCRATGLGECFKFHGIFSIVELGIFSRDFGSDEGDWSFSPVFCDVLECQGVALVGGKESAPLGLELIEGGS